MDEQHHPQAPTLGTVQSHRDTNIAQIFNQFNYDVHQIADEAAQQSSPSKYFTLLDVSGVTNQDFAAKQITLIQYYLAKLRLLILQPEPDVPANLLARWVMRMVAKDSTKAVYEFAGLADERQQLNLMDELERFSEPSLFLVYEASRQILGWNLVALRAALQRRGHVLLAVAAAEISVWRVRQDEEQFWHPVPVEKLFDPDAMERRLRSELLEDQQHFPERIAAEWDERKTIAGQTPTELAHKLCTPLKIIAFSQSLRTLSPTADSQDVARLLDQIAQQHLAESLKRWFYQYLDRHHQLMFLGASLFVGLPEEIFFVHLQHLLVEAWGLRELEGRLLDRADLEGIQTFFIFHEDRAHRVLLESRYSDLRRDLLTLTLNDYQRHLRQAVSWMVNLLRQSGQSGASQRDGLEVYAQRAEVRRVVGEALSDIGLLRLGLVEPMLLALVADQRSDLRAQVARIIAHWYELGQEAAFRQLLQRWSRAKEPIATVQAWLKRSDVTELTDPTDALHACLLLSCAYAARRERPNDITPFLVENLRTLAENPGPRVRQAWGSPAVLSFLELHLTQVTPLLEQLVVYDDVRSKLAERLAVIDAKRAEAVGPLIRDWFRLAAQAPAYVQGDPPNQMDGMLITIVHLLERRVSRTLMGESPSRIRTQLKKIEALPRHPLVQQAVSETRRRISPYDEAMLSDLLASVPLEEKAVAKIISPLYLDERAELQGSEVLFEHKERQFPIWLNGMRPLTRTERLVKNWLIRGESQQQRQLALHISVAQVSAFDQDEQEFLAEQRRIAMNARQKAFEALESEEAEIIVDDDVDFAMTPPNFFCDYLVPIIATRDVPQLQEAIADVLPVARRLNQTAPEPLRFLLREKWPQQDHMLSELGLHLDKALQLCDGGWRGLKISQYPAVLWAILRWVAQAILQIGQSSSSPT